MPSQTIATIPKSGWPVARAEQQGDARGMSTWRWNAILAEGIGTFLFFFVGMGAAVVEGSSLLSVALAHGLVLAVLVSALGAISGGHFNPAVTFGLWMASRIEGRRAVAYVIAQLLGALIAAVAILVVFNGTTAVRLATPGLGHDVDLVRGIAAEVILTAVLLTAVFGTAVDPRAPRIGGLGIGLAVAADILIGGPVTGAAMNPARWFGPAAVAGAFDNALVWIAGPLLGAAIVATLWRVLFLPEADAQTGANV
jgi:MIP family channel proteins